ncbi:MAG: outer rane biosis protein [Verrucomicrobiales bacterium]|nr:outer rane biosis protein [Verrucomicrobiales bacterium]
MKWIYRSWLVLLGGLGASHGFAVEWPEFRGPTGQGTSDLKNVPVHWSATSNVAWSVTIPGGGWSSPVISEGKIYLTSAVQENSGVSLRVICLDESKGSIFWNQEALRADPGVAKQIHSKNSLASPTLIVRDGRIYAHFGHMGTAALDLTGKVLWAQTSIKFPPVHGNGGSPALVSSLLIFSCDGAENPFLAALDAQTGAVRWKTPRNTTARSKFSFSTPLIIKVDGTETIISAASGFVGGYSPGDGKELWRVRYGEGYSVVPRPVFGHGLVYLSSGFDRPILYAIDPARATGDATESHVRWKQAKGAPTTPSPLLLGDELYMVSDGGIASCLNALTGEVHWSERLGGGFSASPVAAEGRIYCVNESGVTSVVRAGKTFEILATNDLGERSLASPALDDASIFIRTESHLWRIGR